MSMIHEGRPRPRGHLKTVPEDFIVDEIPLYEASGEGPHLYIKFKKRDLTTDMATRLIASALGVSARDVGVAGLKDRRAVTTQTISLLIPRGETATFDERARKLQLEGVEVLAVSRHGNKLKTGHLAGNRFDIVVRGVAPERLADVVASLENVGRFGLPNAYGAQRFGRTGDNAERALAWLTGKEPGPRDPRAKRFLWSALQAEIFNAVLERRVADGTWATPEEGDLLQRVGSTGVFASEDLVTDRERASRGEVSPTGPMVGAKMRWPTGTPLAIEREAVTRRLGDAFDFGRTKAFGEGARRPLRVAVKDLEVSALPGLTPASDQGTADRPGVGPGFKESRDSPVPAPREGASIRVRFVLPKGTYATTVLATAVLSDQQDEESGREANATNESDEGEAAEVVAAR